MLSKNPQRVAPGKRKRAFPRERPVEPAELTKAVIESILVEVGSKHVPDDLNRDKLRRDLEVFWGLWRDLSSARLAPHERRRWLQQRLDEARRHRAILAGYFPPWDGRPDPLDLHIARLERELDPWPDVEFGFNSGGLQFAPAKARGSKANKWLFGVRLPEIFEAHFKKRAGVSRIGPYMRFARACRVEFDIRYDDESIINALRARKSTVRRGCKKTDK